MRQSAYRLWES